MISIRENWPKLAACSAAAKGVWCCLAFAHEIGNDRCTYRMLERMAGLDVGDDVWRAIEELEEVGLVVITSINRWGDDIIELLEPSALRAGRPEPRPKRMGSMAWAKLCGRILFRDADTCVYCCGPADTVDHVTPVVQGGSDDSSNLVACCKSCNSRKGGRTPDAAGMEMLFDKRGTEMPEG